MFKNVYIETENFIIRNIQHDDADEFHRVANQAEVLNFLPDEVMSLAEIKELISWFEQCYQKNIAENIIKFPLAIIDKQTNKFIGDCGLGPSDNVPDEIEIFYILAKEYWGKGIMTEVASLVLDYGFRVIKLNKIMATVLKRNIPSQRVLEKIGMKYIKEINDGSLYYSLTRDEWRRNNNEIGVMEC